MAGFAKHLEIILFAEQTIDESIPIKITTDGLCVIDFDLFCNKLLMASSALVMLSKSAGGGIGFLFGFGIC